MKSHFLIRCLMMALLCPVAIVRAQEVSPIQTLVNDIEQSVKYTEVSDIWEADNNFDRTAMLQKVSKAQPLTISYSAVVKLLENKDRAIHLSIPAENGKTYTINLAKFDFLSSDFQLHVLGENGTDELFNYTPGLYYRGVVDGIEGSVAAFSFFNNEVFGIFSIPGAGNFNVVPNTMAGKYYDNSHYILYNDQDLLVKQFAPSCGTDDLPEPPKSLSKTTTTLNNNVYNNCTEIKVFEVGDYAFYSTHGHNVTTSTNYLTALFNNQSTLYRNEGILIALKYLQINTATDNYQHITTADSHIFLDTFGKVTMNVLHGCDLAILASTALNGGYGALGGVAWVKAMCSTYDPSSFFGPYGFCDLDNSTGVVNFPTFSWDVMVMAHEMGHIVGSPHTHRCCWNPSGTGTTAIDACETLEGSCATPVPALPPAGGTIMSYCHNTTVGINFSNGFGPQPGGTIRYFISHTFSGSCGENYFPGTALTSVNRATNANRECTDMTSGITYYWNDNNTASQTDDTLVLMIKKNGNDIGNLNATGFAVTAATTAHFGIGKADTISFPTGTAGVYRRNMAMRRYWKVTPTKAPTTAVEVIFPFTSTDSSDVDGSVPGTTLLSNFKMYKAKSTIDPSPVSGFTGAVASDFNFYSYGPTATATNWSMSTTGTTKLAHMVMTNLSGGGTGFYTYLAAGVENINSNDAGISVYPNPTDNSWFFSVEKNNGAQLSLQLYTVDGKLILRQLLNGNSVNEVPTEHLVPGMYFYRIVSSSNTYTGNLLKK